ncbi:MAG TPA: sigma-70 family RNA polymerase sigma factor [Nocardioidaceae bacterium]|nr:sigma-70 family RNA polymerase sigma factor [Nocardioidaceae bacterium]
MEQRDRFDVLFGQHASRLVRLAALLGADDPEDVAAEAFCRLYAARRRLREDDAAVVGYLNRIVVNLVRDRQRRATVARRDAHLLVPRTLPPDAIASHADRRAVAEALARLPHRQREVVVLRFWLDLPLGQIADATGVSAGTVKSQLSRGLCTLAEVLEEDR